MTPTQQPRADQTDTDQRQRARFRNDFVLHNHDTRTAGAAQTGEIRAAYGVTTSTTAAACVGTAGAAISGYARTTRIERARAARTITTGR